ncbi:SH3 and multiple ankyrin repeat domains protein 2-like [Rhopilema esculentum]|uniref:SH3 and multiple ankyrin repeat domains protein 2-like n=1 Tax=Rhopilema esculentum TaxID=499914 RepID=UPI0031E3BB55
MRTQNQLKMETDQTEYRDVKVVIVYERKPSKTFKFCVDDTVWTAKQAVLLEFSSLNLTDPLNYGFYMPPFKGKAGKFLDEERPLRDYPAESYGEHLEFRYKRRIYRALNMDEKKLQKYQSKSYQKKFFECLMTGNTEKSKKFLEKGLDPNFQNEYTGETPLTAMIMLPNSFEACMMLVNFGAQLDYRSADGMTAMHKAVLNSRADSISFLLDLGASPNYKDAKGLTALWHGILSAATDHCCELLLNERSILGACDHQGTQEIHLACRKGLDKHLEHLIFYRANLNCRTATGNTPLHICAIGNQLNCARILLFRGADRTVLNYANQSAYENAILSGNHEIATLIEEFDNNQVTPFQEKPVYSRRRRVRTAHPSQQISSTHETVPEHKELPRSATVSSRVELDQQKASKDAMFLKSSKKTTNNNLAVEHKAGDTDDSASDLSDSDDESTNKHKKVDRRTFSTGAMSKKAPAPIKAGPSTKSQLKSRLYQSIPGRQFIAVVDYQPQAPGELALEKGDSVEVLFIGEQGFWEGRVKERTGWFPSACLQELKKTNKKENYRTWFGKKSGNKGLFEKPSKLDLAVPRIVHFRKGDKGFGFQLRGANSHAVRIEFTPTPEFPALQYIGEVDKGGTADKIGLKPGDFVLEVNGEDVTNATHGYVVSLVANTGKALSLKVITVTPQSFSPELLVASPKLSKSTQSKNNEEKLPQKDTKKTPPPPPPRSQYSSMTVGHLGGGSSLPDCHILPANVDTVMTLDKKVQRKRSVKSMWSDTALKLHPDNTRTEEISKGVVRKTKGVSMSMLEENTGLSQRSGSVSSNSACSTPNVNNTSHFATLPRRFSRSSSQNSDETASSDSNARPQPPGYEATLETWRRVGRKPSFQRGDSERKLVAKADPVTKPDARDRTESSGSDVFPPPPTMIPAAPSYSPPPPPPEETHPSTSRSLSVPATVENPPRAPATRTASEPTGPQSQSSDEDEPTSDFALALRNVVKARKQRNRSSKLSIDETVAQRRKDQGLHVINENEPVRSSGIPKSSSADTVLQTKDSKNPDYHNLYAASSTSSLDTQISKDSGIDVSDVLGQAPGEQPPDLASALANAVARRAEKIAKNGSTTKTQGPSTVSSVNQHNIDKGFLGVKLKSVNKESCVKAPAQDQVKHNADISNKGPPPIRPKPQSRASCDDLNVVAESINASSSSIVAEPSSQEQKQPETRLAAQAETRSDIVTPPLMFASANSVNESNEGPHLDSMDGVPQEPPLSPLPPPPSEFMNNMESFPQDISKTAPVMTNMAADPPPPYSPPRVKSDLPASISNKPYPEWNSEEVGFWLDYINMGQYKVSFLENDIQGLHLADLSKDDLSELGVKKLGHRLTIDDAIGKLRNQLQFSELSIDETVAQRRKDQGLHVINENEPVRSSGIPKSSSADTVLQTKDSKNPDYHNLYAASSTSSLDTQISKDSGIDVSDVLGQAPGEQPPDLASALANAVARRAEKIAKNGSTTKTQGPSTVSSVNQHNIDKGFLGVKLKSVNKESCVKAPAQDPVKHNADISNKGPPPIRPKPQSRASCDDLNVVAESINASSSSIVAEPSSQEQKQPETRLAAQAETRSDIVTPPLMFASANSVNESNEGPHLDSMDGVPQEPPLSPLPPPPSEFMNNMESFPQDISKTAPVMTNMAADPPPPYSPPRVKSDLPASISNKPYPEWNSEEVGFWLDYINMGQYKVSFLENDIQGLHLADLSKDDLSELGVKKLGHRLTIDDAIGKLRNQLQFSEV